MDVISLSAVEIVVDKPDAVVEIVDDITFKNSKIAYDNDTTEGGCDTRRNNFETLPQTDDFRRAATESAQIGQSVHLIARWKAK